MVSPGASPFTNTGSNNHNLNTFPGHTDNHKTFHGHPDNHHPQSHHGRGRYGKSSLNRRVDQLSKDMAFIKSALKTLLPKKSQARIATTEPDDNGIIDTNLDQLNEQSDSTDSERKYILDSGSHPSIINHTLHNQQKLTTPIHTVTASHQPFQTKYSGVLRLVLNNKQPVSISALHNPQINANLISVRDLARKCRSIFFTKDKATIGQCVSKPTYHSTPATASWRNGCYFLDSAPPASRQTSTPKRLTISRHPSLKTTAESITPALTATTPPIKASTIPTFPHPNRSPAQNLETYAPCQGGTRQPRQTRPSNKPSASTIKPLPHAAAKFPAPPTTNPHHIEQFHKWHPILNHINTRTIHKMALDNLLPLPAQLKHAPPPLSCSGCLHG